MSSSINSDGPDYSLGVDVPDRDTRSEPVLPQVSKRSRPRRRSQTVHDRSPDSQDKDAEEEEDVSRRFRMVRTESAHQQGPDASRVKIESSKQSFADCKP